MPYPPATQPGAPATTAPPKRLYWHQPHLDGGEGLSDTEIAPDPAAANLIGSLCTNGRHAPVLDLDFPAQLVASSTPGHFHLYLDTQLTTEQYFKLLDVLAEVGILEAGFVDASKYRGASMVRKPGVLKPGAIDVEALQLKVRLLEEELAQRDAQEAWT